MCVIIIGVFPSLLLSMMLFLLFKFLCRACELFCLPFLFAKEWYNFTAEYQFTKTANYRYHNLDIDGTMALDFMASKGAMK